jgi:hydroxymethylbilane synthase
LSKKIIIGTRGSELALWQANWIKSRIAELHPELPIDVRVIKTQGDSIPDAALHELPDKGFFTKAIEDELLSGTVDIAVHSLKDLPTRLPNRLAIAAVSDREDPRDVLISQRHNSINELPEGAAIATGSLRRRAQLLNYRKDLNIIDIRGNITTRIKKYQASDWDGMILACAGLRRLGLERHIKEVISEDVILPAVSQGVMAVECREDDKHIIELLKPIHNQRVFTQVLAERSLLRKLEGGCQVPIGVYTRLHNHVISLKAMVASPGGKKITRCEVRGDSSKPEEVGTQAAEELLKVGAGEILEELKNKSNPML